MPRFLLRRVLQSLVLLLVVTSGTFFLVHLTPGGPEAALTQNPRIGPEETERLRERFGLNDPLPVQYLKWLEAMGHLDFGRSYTYARPAIDIVGERMGPTLQLGFVSFLVGLCGIPLGLYAALHRNGPGDMLVRLLSTFGHAVPSWWLGLSAIVLLSTLFNWFPSGQGEGGLLDWLKHITLPAVILGMTSIVSFSRFVRSETLEVLEQDYVRTARAKGLSPGQVSSLHVFRNVLLPIVTILGFLLPGLLSGALITEVIFSWPGMGRLFYEAATTRDYPLIMATLTMFTVATILGTLLADVTYGLVDPRVRYA